MRSFIQRADVGTLLKRCVDLLGATALIAIFLPLFGVTAALILIGDGWPVIYRRRVIGRQGEFDALKFRTMRQDADSVLASNPILLKEYQRNFKLMQDPRVTKLGAFLRKFSIDELPQLFNVVRGQMSLVGPRMITVAELPKYGDHQDLLL